MKRRGMRPQQAARIRADKGIEETKLQKMRVKRDLSQSELSAISGVPLRNIQYYEQNKGTIDRAKFEVLCALCSTLRCKIEDILEDKRLITLYTKIK